MTYEEWIKEVEYIKSIDPKNPGGSFNNDPECFKRYVKMQSDQAEREGYTGIKKLIIESFY